MSLIHGSKGGGGGSSPVEADDTLSSTAYAQILDLLGEGPIAGFPDNLPPARCIYFNDTPLQNADGSWNFQVKQLDYRLGYVDQTYIPGFESSAAETQVGVALTASQSWSHTFTNVDISAARITLSVAGLSKTDTNTGNISGYRVAYQIQLSKDGGSFSTVIDTAFDGKASSTYTRSHRIELSGAKSQYTVRVVRLTPDSTTQYVQDKTSVVSYAEVIDAKLTYPYSALVALQIDAEQFSSMPTRAYDVLGLLVKYPSNYNPKTRVYTGTWDGTFSYGWTDNPAWIFYDLVLNKRYGLGRYVDATMLDRYALYQIARYCDVLVSDGKGGQEPRFTCNCYITTRADAIKVLQDLASVFRGIAYWSAGSVIASADMPSDPVYVYTASNVIKGEFKYAGSSLRTRYTTALVTYNDPANAYKQTVEYVEDADGISRYGINKAEITAFGCTSRSQAQRVGQWMLLTSRYETNAVTFSVGMDGTLAQPGQVIAVADASRARRRIGGRLKDVGNSSTVMLDSPAPPPVSVQEQPVATGDGTTKSFQLIGATGEAITSGVSVKTLYRDDWQGKQLLYPTPRTNRFINSQNFSASGWQRSQLGASLDASVSAPDGTRGAWQLIPNTTNAAHYMDQHATYTAGDTATRYGIFKAGSMNLIELRVYGSPTNNYSGILVDLKTGQFRTVGNGTYERTYSVTGLVDGWWLISQTVAFPADTGTDHIFRAIVWTGTLDAPTQMYAGDGVGYLYSWAQHCEFGAIAGSYIPTSAAPVTATDYALLDRGRVEIAAAPANGSRISWSGTGAPLPENSPDIAKGDKLTVILPTGRAESRTVSAVSFPSLSVSPQFSVAPSPGAVWMVESGNLQAQLFRVTSVSEKDGITFEISATQHEPGKYAAIDSGAAIDPAPITGLPLNTQQAPGNVRLSQYVVIDQGIARSNMTIAWDSAPNAIAYIAEFRKDNGDWLTVGRTGGLSLDVSNIYTGRYAARVRAVNALDIVSPYSFSTESVLNGKTGAPPLVASLAASTTQVFSVSLDWSFPSGAADTAYTEVFYSHTPDFSKAVIQGRYSYPTNTTKLLGLAAGYDLYFWARLVDRTGNIGAWYPGTAQAGIRGMSSSDATEILSYLTGQIGETQLGKDVLQPIKDIPGIKQSASDNAKAIAQEVLDRAAAVTGEAQARADAIIGEAKSRADAIAQEVKDRTAAIAKEAADRANAVADEARQRGAAVTAEQTARQTADNSLGQRIDTVTASVGEASSAIKQEATARTSADTALGQRIDTVVAQVGDATSSIQQEQTARIDADGALGKRIDTVSADVGKNSAAIQAEAKARVDADSALSTRIDSVVATASGNTASISAEATARASADTALGKRVDAVTADVGANKSAITSEQQARADADTALGKRVDSVTATANANSAAITQEQSARVTGDAANADSIAAVQAQTNAKNTTFRQSITPVAKAVNDVWIDLGSTNLLRYSEDYTGSAWSRQRCSVVPKATTGPDGSAAAQKLVESSDNGEHYVNQTPKIDTTQPMTRSLYVKAGERTQLLIRVFCLNNTGTVGGVVFDATTGKFSSPSIVRGVHSYGAAQLSDGWWRISHTVQFTTADTAIILRTQVYNGSATYQGDGSSGIYVWGEQLEAASGAGRYISTGSESVNTVGNNSLSVWDGNTWVPSQDIGLANNAAAIASEASARATSDDALSSRLDTVTASASANTAAISGEQKARADADSALSSRVDAVTATANGNAAAITAEQKARADGDSANASAISSLSSKVSDNTAALTNEATARANADSALSSRIERVSAQINVPMAGDTGGKAGSTSVYAGVWSEQSARAEADLALSQRIDTVTAQFDSANSDALAAVRTESEARADADSAQAQQISTVQAQVNDNAAAVQTVAQSYADLNGQLSASYTVKTQITKDGRTYMAGISVGVNGNGGDVESQVLVAASRFAVIDPNGSAVNSPFVIQGGQVFLNEALIGNGFIKNAMIGNYIQSDNYVAGRQGWRLDKSGWFEINNTDGQGNRLNIDSNGVRGYDANETLRYRLGFY